MIIFRLNLEYKNQVRSLIRSKKLFAPLWLCGKFFKPDFYHFLKTLWFSIFVKNLYYAFIFKINY
jgi:hypothetical protein